MTKQEITKKVLIKLGFDSLFKDFNKDLEKNKKELEKSIKDLKKLKKERDDLEPLETKEEEKK